MPQATSSTIMAGGGYQIGRGRVREADALHTYIVDLPAGDAGELTTRTNDTVGEATMDSATHGITTGMDVDIFWTGGRRYGVTVGTVAGTAVPFSGGSGDVLPSTSTGLTITERVDASTAIDGDKIQLIGMEHQLDDDSESANASVEFLDSGASQVVQVDLEPNVATITDVAGGATNIFTGNPITDLKAANGSSTQAARLVILSLEDLD